MLAHTLTHTRTHSHTHTGILKGPVRVADWLLCWLQILLITSITGEASARSSLFAALSRRSVVTAAGKRQQGRI